MQAVQDEAGFLHLQKPGLVLHCLHAAAQSSTEAVQDEAGFLQVNVIERKRERAGKEG